MPKKKKMPDLDKYIIFSIASIIIYTIAAYVVVVMFGCQLDILTTLFFGFFGGEITICALIKKLKLKNVQKENKEEQNYG